MDEKALHQRIVELDEMLAALPRPDGEAATLGSYVPQGRSPASRPLDELLDHVRLQVRYVMFDLEATRRENGYLRQMLERRSNTSDGPE